MKTAYLGLGSNVGERLEQLESAIKILDNVEGVQVSQISSVYETEPVGYVDQPNFLNLCVEVKTELTPQQLLQQCFYTEQER
jgi:2-amino-4-hydroxy-6-hydroxymethyldihydropteridine diphosphokinase